MFGQMGAGFGRLGAHGRARPFSPLSLFANGESGFLYDFSKLDRMWQENTGATAVSADGQTVGLALDEARWAGKTLAEVIAASTAVLSDDFSSYADTAAMVAAGWTNATLSSITLENGKLKATNGASSGYCYRSFPTVAGRTYRVSYRQELGTVSTADVVFASTPSGSDILALGSVWGIGNNAAGYFTAVGSTTYLRLRTGSPAGGTAFLDNVEIREIPSIPASQSTSAARPKYDTDNGGCLRFDGSDDGLLTTWNPSSAAMTLAARFRSDTSGRSIMGSVDGSSNRLALIHSGNVLCGAVGAQSSGTITGGTSITGLVVTGVITCDGTTVKLYLDGAEIYSGAQSGVPNTTRGIALGCYNNDNSLSSFMTGDIMDALAINRALTPAEVARLSTYWSAN